MTNVIEQVRESLKKAAIEGRKIDRLEKQLEAAETARQNYLDDANAIITASKSGNAAVAATSEEEAV